MKKIYKLNGAEASSLMKIAQDGLLNVHDKHRVVAEDLSVEIAEALAQGKSIVISQHQESAQVLTLPQVDYLCPANDRQS